MTEGDITTVRSGIIVHGCNAQGVMGSGVAKAIRQAFPEAYRRYAEAANDERGLILGRVVWAKVSDEPLLAVANAITQEFYGRSPGFRYVDYDAVRCAFRKIGEVARRKKLTVHYPMIGAGLGGGDWETIRRIIDEELSGVDHRLWVMGPSPNRKPAKPNGSSS